MSVAARRREGVRTKAPTGITGFDEITGGGLPRSRTTLVVGGAGVRQNNFCDAIPGVWRAGMQRARHLCCL
jgi:RecA/RadA recombinase